MAKTWTDYEARLSRVTDHIYAHLDEALDFDALADVAAMSPYHWHRIYSAMRGESATATVRRLRLQRAAVALAQGERAVEKIGARAGYASAAAFTRAFGEAYGLPPARYRASGSHADFKPGQLDAPRASWTVRTEPLASLPLVAVEHRGAYMDVGHGFELLFAQAGAQAALPEVIRLIAVFHDDPTLVDESELRSLAAIVAPGESALAAPLVRARTRPGDYAILRHKGPYAGMRAAYLWMFGTWLPRSRREADDAPVLEEYLNSPHDTPPSELLTELMLPLRGRGQDADG